MFAHAGVKWDNLSPKNLGPLYLHAIRERSNTYLWITLSSFPNILYVLFLLMLFDTQNARNY